MPFEDKLKITKSRALFYGPHKKHTNPKRRRKLEDDSSISITETSSEDSYIQLFSQKENLEEHDEQRSNILENIFFIDSDDEEDEQSSTAESKSYLSRDSSENSIAAYNEFLNRFSEVPDITEISEDSEDDDTHRKSSADKGIFVDPLTGKVLERQRPKPVQQEIIETEKQNEDKESSYEDEYEAADASTVEVEKNEYVLDIFANLEKLDKKLEIEKIDWETLNREQEAKALTNFTFHIIQKLIDKAVNISEYKCPDTILRENLDKKKLMIEIKKQIENLKQQKLISAQLNHEIVDHFVRKHNFKPITKLNKKIFLREKQNYYKTAIGLDQLLAKEDTLLKITQEKLKELEKQHQIYKQKVEAEILSFEDLVRKTLCKESMPKLNEFIQVQLRRMSKFRQEISKERLSFILQEHTKAYLLEKLFKLEDLGNGLSMREFVNLQTETLALEEKIHHRNAELCNSHTRYELNVQAMAHIEQSRKILETTIESQRKNMQELLYDQECLRDKIHQLKIERKYIRKELNDLSFQGGLMDKPALLLDFDDTIRNIDAKSKSVWDLKKALNELQRKIDIIEKKCKGRGV